jgi:tetratricopeptide (TPR) repeat protein
MPTQRHILAGALVVITMVAYYPVIRNGGFIWDDDQYLELNRTLQTAEGLRRIWFEPGATPQYYPLVFTTFWLEYQLWELRPAGYHVVNVLLHAFNAVLLWGVLSRLSLPGAWFAAAVFALHPVQVESVAWISERKNVLSGFFYLSASWAYLRFRHGFFSRPSPTESSNTEASAPYVHSRWFRYGLVIALYVAALFSKTVTCSLPAAILLVLWWKRGRITRDDLLTVLPMFVLGLAFAAITVWMEKEHVGAEGKEWDLSVLDRVLIAGRALWFYAGKLVWPVDLTFIYPRWQIDPSAWRQYVFPVAALGVVIVLWLGRHRLGRGPLVAVLYFAGTLLPALGFINIYPMRYSFVADHFQYLASIGLIALAASTVASASQNMSLRAERVGLAAGVATLGVLGCLTWRQAGVYENLVTLWTDTIRKNPACAMAHYNLGKLYLQRGRYAEAEKHLAESVAIRPDLADGHSEWARLCQEQGRYDDAMRHIADALRIDPHHAPSLLSYGVALAEQGKSVEAIQKFNELLQLNPNNALACYNMGLVYVRLDNTEEAVRFLTRAVEADPGLAVAYADLGRLQLRQGRIREAVEILSRGLALRPRDSHYRDLLGQALRAAGRFDDAADQFREAERLRAIGL